MHAQYAMATDLILLLLLAVAEVELFSFQGSGLSKVVRQYSIPPLPSANAIISLTLPSYSVPNL